MLIKKQLEDAASCSAQDCRKCSVKKYTGVCGSGHCTEEAAQTALAYREMLERLEWVDNDYCPVCWQYKSKGHKPDCELAVLLKGDE
jgi:hypothetical protein